MRYAPGVGRSNGEEVRLNFSHPRKRECADNAAAREGLVKPVRAAGLFPPQRFGHFAADPLAEFRVDEAVRLVRKHFDDRVAR